MQDKTALITRPDHEPVTKYLCLWSEEILTLAKHKGVSIYDLKGKKANRKTFESYMSKHSPTLVLLNGHGNAEVITGYDNEPIVDKNSVIENSIIYGRSCDAGQILGGQLVNKGTRAFIGYKRKFILGYTPERMMKPLDDPIARLFLEPSNLVATSLIKGNTTLEAHRRSHEAMSKNFRRMLSSVASLMKKSEGLPMGKYEHYKGGVYEVVGVASHSETLEKMVVYKHLDDGRVWVRPLAMFTELVEVNGTKVPRFRKVL